MDMFMIKYRLFMKLFLRVSNMDNAGYGVIRCLIKII